MQAWPMLSRRQLLQWAPVGAALSVGTACGSASPPESPASGPSPHTTASAATSGSATASGSAATEIQQRARAKAYADLAEDLGELGTADDVSFALALRDPEAGLDFAHHGDRILETASIAKVDILAALLLQAQDRGQWLTPGQRSLADQMIRVSSNDAAWELWAAVGGSSGLDRANRRLALTHTQTRPDSWGLTKTTPRDQVRLVERMADPARGPLNRESSAYALGLMRSVAPEQAWGISAAARRHEVTALKNGWLPRSADDGRWITHSIGRITGKGVDLRLAILSHGHAGYGEGVELVEKLARLVRGHLYP